MHVTPIVFICAEKRHATEALQLHDAIFHDEALSDNWELAQQRVASCNLVSQLVTNVQKLYAIAHGLETGIYVGFQW